MCFNDKVPNGEYISRDAHRLRRFSSEKGSASLEIFLTLDLPRAMMSEDGEPSEERGDVGGPWALGRYPPFSSACSVGMDRLVIVHSACGRPMKVVKQRSEQLQHRRLRLTRLSLNGRHRPIGLAQGNPAMFIEPKTKIYTCYIYAKTTSEQWCYEGIGSAVAAVVVDGTIGGGVSGVVIPPPCGSSSPMISK